MATAPLIQKSVCSGCKTHSDCRTEAAGCFCKSCWIDARNKRVGAAASPKMAITPNKMEYVQTHEQHEEHGAPSGKDVRSAAIMIASQQESESESEDSADSESEEDAEQEAKKETEKDEPQKESKKPDAYIDAQLSRERSAFRSLHVAVMDLMCAKHQEWLKTLPGLIDQFKAETEAKGEVFPAAEYEFSPIDISFEALTNREHSRRLSERKRAQDSTMYPLLDALFKKHGLIEFDVPDTAASATTTAHMLHVQSLCQLLDDIVRDWRWGMSARLWVTCMSALLRPTDSSASIDVDANSGFPKELATAPVHPDVIFSLFERIYNHQRAMLLEPDLMGQPSVLACIENGAHAHDFDSAESYCAVLDQLEMRRLTYPLGYLWFVLLVVQQCLPERARETSVDARCLLKNAEIQKRLLSKLRSLTAMTDQCVNDMSGARTWYNHTANVFLTPTEANFIQDSKANKGKRVRIEKLLSMKEALIRLAEIFGAVKFNESSSSSMSDSSLVLVRTDAVTAVKRPRTDEEQQQQQCDEYDCADLSLGSKDLSNAKAEKDVRQKDDHERTSRGRKQGRTDGKEHTNKIDQTKPLTKQTHTKKRQPRRRTNQKVHLAGASLSPLSRSKNHTRRRGFVMMNDDEVVFACSDASSVARLPDDQVVALASQMVHCGFIQRVSAVGTKQVTCSAPVTTPASVPLAVSATPSVVSALVTHFSTSMAANIVATTHEDDLTNANAKKAFCEKDEVAKWSRQVEDLMMENAQLKDRWTAAIQVQCRIAQELSTAKYDLANAQAEKDLRKKDEVQNNAHASGPAQVQIHEECEKRITALNVEIAQIKASFKRGRKRTNESSSEDALATTLGDVSSVAATAVSRVSTPFAATEVISTPPRHAQKRHKPDDEALKTTTAVEYHLSRVR